MRLRLVAVVATFSVVVALAALCAAQSALAQDGKIPCDAFSKNADGSWTANTSVEFPGPGRSYNIAGGANFKPTMSFMGLNVAAELDKSCPVEAMMAPEPGAPPRVEISKLADASGAIDVEKLTCAQLADTYQEDADFLLSWYSGWSNGLAKMHAVNVAQVKAGIHDVIVYCKANKDRLVVQAIDAIRGRR
jgi:hypothetical protein